MSEYSLPRRRRTRYKRYQAPLLGFIPIPRIKFTWPIAVSTVCFSISGILFLISLLSGSTTNQGQAVAKTKNAPVAVKTSTALTSKMLFVGDVNWGRYTEKRADASPLGYDYVTSGLTPEDRSNYDAWIGNFECPVTTKSIPYEQQVDSLKFNCRPEFLPALGKYFTAGSLANNHTDNNDGRWGLDQTRQNLQQAGIQYFGTYNMVDTDDICEVIAIPAKTETDETVDIPVAMCGYMYVVNVQPTDAQLEVMSQYAKYMPVIAVPHMGVEYRSTAESEKISAYQRMIDAGADIVIAAHPHVIQNMENYKGRLIVYSLGNFLFDQQSLGQDTSLGLGLGLDLKIGSGAAAEEYQRIGSSCKSFKDSCLSVLKNNIDQRPAMDVAYSFTCYDITSGIPVKGSEQLCATANQKAGVQNLGSLNKQW